MKRKHLKTLQQIYARPVNSSIKWADIESLFIALGAEIMEREGSRVAVSSTKKWLEAHRVKP